MNTTLLFSSASDEWATPQETFDALHAEFAFDVDLAASAENHKLPSYFTKEGDALGVSWRHHALGRHRGWLNPPYSRGLCKKFIAKAADERTKGFLTVMLLPARTDTQAFHAHIWDKETYRPRAGVEVRFLAGRLRFGGCKHAAPFPSMVVVFRP